MENNDTEILLEPMLPDHWPQVSAIYGEGIATGNATFETTVPSWDHWDQAHHSQCRWVAVRGSKVAGWAALSPVSSRCVYGGVAEVSIYVAVDARGLGVGRALMEKLVNCSEQWGIWTLQAGIFPENRPSIALHQSFGFHIVGVRQRLGQLAGVWRDVMLLERRSSVVGV